MSTSLWYVFIGVISIFAAVLDDQRMDPKVTFISLKKRLADLLQKMLTCETDSVNTQMLLGKFSFDF